MEGPSSMACQPFADLGMFVDSVIVEDRVHQLSGRHLRFDGIEEANELLVPVALHAAADNAAIQHVQCSEQGGGTVAPIVMLVWTAADGIEVPE